MYPRTLIVGHLEEGMTGQDDLDAEEGQIADSDLVEIVAQLGDRLLPKVLEVTRVLRLDTGSANTWTPTWTSSIVSGDPEAAACLLITLLPNLEKLRIVDRWRFYDSPPFYSTLNSLFKAANNSKRDLKGLNSFKKLSEVGLHGSGDGAGVDFAVVPDFSVLPSIGTIKGRCIDGESGVPAKAGFPVLKPNSNITILEFHQSSIDKGSFYDCIKRIKALRKFTYGFCAAATVGDQT